jgi:tetratricopeptide (TPR) repeat protein
MKTTQLKHLFRVILINFIFLTGSLNIYSQITSGYGREADSLIALIKKDQPDTLKVFHLAQLGWTIMYQNPDSAIEICNEALELGNQIANSPAANQDAKLKKTASNGISIAYNNIGFTYYLKGEYKTSLSNHFKALEIREKYKNKKGLMSSYNNIGVVYRDQGDYPKALDYFFRAIRFAQELDNKNAIATILNNVGNIYHSEKDYIDAIKAYSNGLTMAEEAGNKNLAGNLMMNMGSSYLQKKDNKIALELFLKALKLNEEVQNQFAIAANMICIANAYHAEEKPDSAFTWYSKALVVNKAIDNKNGIAVCLGNLGIHYFHKGKHKEAETHLLAALDISKKIEATDLIMNETEGLSELYSATKQFDLAYKYHVEYMAAKDSLFNHEKSKEIGRLEAKHETELEAMKVQEAYKAKIAKQNRRNLLQYNGIVVLLLIIGLLVGVLGFVKVKPWQASAITFFAFLLFFEFLLVLLDPYVDQFSNGEPAYKLVLNAGIAACIFPIHAFFERRLKKRLVKE